jgi:predicted nucleic acid-binding protein
MTGETVDLVVDTSVWSLFFRREKRDDQNPYVRRLRQHLQHEDNIHIPGPVLQELLDGVRGASQFDILSGNLAPFPLIEGIRSDFIDAARLKNKCRSRGVQAGTVDFFIASVCINRNYPLLTADRDFEYIARHCGLVLVPV